MCLFCNIWDSPESKQGDSKPFISICETTPLQQSDINNHNSHKHTDRHTVTYVRTLTHLLKWNTQSLTFTSVPPYTFDRERIQTEWNPHQHGCCAIDLSSPFTHWNEHNHHVSGYMLVFRNDTEKEKEKPRKAKKERERASVREIKGAPSQCCTLENCWRRRKTMQILPCAGQISNFRQSGRGRKKQKWDRITDE